MADAEGTYQLQGCMFGQYHQPMQKPAPKPRPGNEYDKIFKENMQQALPGLIERLLLLDVAHSQDLPNRLQQTEERETDVLQRVTDTDGNTFVLHIEWQLKNDPEMIYRMGEYRMMLMRKYRLPVKQYLLFIGKGRPTMQTNIDQDGLLYNYQLIALSKVDYKLFLQSKQPAEKLLALLANFGRQKKEQVVATIIRQVQQSSSSDLIAGKHFNQLRVLAQLRNLPFKIEDMLESISTFFKEEKDPFYIRGANKGLEKGIEKGMEKGLEKGREEGETKKSRKVVINLIEKFGFDDKQAAAAADVSVAFVKEVRNSLKTR